MKIKINVSEHEFVSHFVDISQNKKTTITTGLMHTIDYCFEKTIEGHSHITKISFLDRYEGPYSTDSLGIEEYIQKGRCTFNWYKIKCDSIKDDSIETIDFIFPEYLVLEDNSVVLTAEQKKKILSDAFLSVPTVSHKKFYVKKRH